MRFGRIIDALRRLHNPTLPILDVPPEHIATYTEAVIYYTFVFGDSPVSPHAVADRLLAAELAETVTSPADGEVLMAPRYKELARTIRKAEGIAEVGRAIDGGRLLGWICKNPLLAAEVAVLVFGRRLKRAIGRKIDGAGKPSDTDEGVEGMMRDLIDKVNHAVAKRQALNAIQHAREQDMYQPAYLESEPYLRLTLRSANFALAGFDGQEGGAAGQAGEVLLLVHQSGVFQLTVAVRMPEGIDTDELISRSIGSGVEFSWSEVAEPVLLFASKRLNIDRRRMPGKWLSEVREGTRWRRFDHAEPVSLVDLFRTYQHAILEASGASGDEWLCHATVCIDRLGCCETQSAWTSRHRAELTGMLLRDGGYAGLREAATLKLPPDTSIRMDHSVWHGHASTLLMHWGEGSRHFDDHLWTLLLGESFLLQYWQLRALDKSLQMIESQRTAKGARALQRRLIFGLQEFHRSALSYGSAQDQVLALLRESGAERIRAQIGERLDQLGAIDASERAERVAARSTAAAVAAFIVAVIFGLPAIDQTLNLVRSIPGEGVANTLSGPLQGLANLGVAGSFISYVAVLAVFLAALLAFGLPRRQYRPRRIRRAGGAWVNGTIKVVRHHRSEHREMAED
ncbi:hypothetical protein ACIBTV_28090 [Micromonospora sp. NPDC049366]|uniref:hypothetical protein n=1 Tax=Micromonospora sp. NPDC049366 TaxID=3364271 RepID=UPI0037A499A8